MDTALPSSLEPSVVDHATGLLEAMPIACALLARDGSITWTNRRFRSLLPADAIDPVALVARIERGDRGLLVGLETYFGKVSFRAHCVQSEQVRMLVLDDTPGLFDAESLRALHQKVAKLESESMRDSLTGAWNRRYIDETLAIEVQRSRRYRHPLGAALLDIDHFKRVNDRFGHLTGDCVLRGIVALLGRERRAADIVARWGGEEFLILMPATAYAAAATAAEKLRAAIASHDFATAGRITVSLGVAELLDGEAAESLFARLDAALYSAKQGGRDRVVVDPRGASDAWLQEKHSGVVKLVWNVAYECGEPVIDAQHRELFRLANALIAASVAPATRGELLRAMDACFGHVAVHFAEEERILTARGYPRLALHHQMHAALLERAKALRAAAMRGEALLGQLVEFLAQEVVARHMLTADRDFFPIFRARASEAGH